MKNEKKMKNATIKFKNIEIDIEITWITVGSSDSGSLNRLVIPNMTTFMMGAVVKQPKSYTTDFTREREISMLAEREKNH